MKSLRLISSILFLAVISVQCTEVIDDSLNQPLTTDLSQNLLTQEPEIHEYLSCQGFNTTTLLLVDDYVIIENDIAISVDQLKNITKNNNTRQGPDNRISQYVLNPEGVVGINNVYNIPFFIDNTVNSIPGNWPAAIRTATSSWSNLPNSRIIFVEVFNAIQADIVFYSDANTNTNIPACTRNLPADTYARAAFSEGDRIGAFISINDNDLSDTQSNRETIIRHELGHTLGFRHDNAPATESTNFTWCGSNLFGANLVAGTPTSDGVSIMLGSIGPSTSRTLSANDKKAASLLYPLGPIYPSYPYSGPQIQSISKFNTLNPNTKDISIAINTPAYHFYRYRVERLTPWGGSVLQSTEYTYTSYPSLFLLNVPHGSWSFRVSVLNYRRDLVLQSTAIQYNVQ